MMICTAPQPGTLRLGAFVRIQVGTSSSAWVESSDQLEAIAHVSVVNGCTGLYVFLACLDDPHDMVNARP